MQLDIFEHSRDVLLRNAVIDALRSGAAAAAGSAIAELAAEHGDDPLLPLLGRLHERLILPVAARLDRESAAAVLRRTEDAAALAAQVFASEADAWLAPLWCELAAASAHLAFDAGNEDLHATPILLRAGKWAEAAAGVDAIPSWRRLPAPLSWKIVAEYETSGLDAAWPMLVELSWMAPLRAARLARTLGSAELLGRARRFDAEFEGDGEDEDFAWFPAWMLVTDARWVAASRLAQRGAETAPERCARLLLSLDSLERQGRQAEVYEGRKKLRAMHPHLFDLYMRSR
jgi:hypothetical protein